MKLVLAGISLISLTLITNHALADCPSSLNADQMLDCIVTENDGYYYTPRGKNTSMDDQYIEPSTSTANKSDDTNIVILNPTDTKSEQ